MRVPVTMRSRVTTVLVGAITLLAPGAANAQPDEGLRDRARTFLVLRLTEALDLSDEEALGASRILEESEDRRRELETRRRTVEAEIRDALGESPSDREALRALVERALGIDQEMALVPAESFRKLREMLTVEQQAKLVLARPKIHAEIQSAIRRRLEARARGEAPGAPPTRSAPDPTGEPPSD